MTALATTVLADSWGMHHGDVGIGWWIVMMLGMIVFWGAIVALVVRLLRGSFASRGEAPHEVLRRRLADGSISIEEYEQRRAALESSTQARRDDTPRGGTTGGPPGPSASPST
jgi:putative membrane protein